MNFIKNYLNRKANNFARPKSTLETFWVVVMILLAVSVVNSFISINSSREFFETFTPYAIPEIGNYKMAAIIISVIIEGLTLLFLYLFFYHILRKHLLAGVFILIFTGAIYYANYQSATHGLEDKTEQQASNKKQIQKQLSKDSLRIFTYYDNIIDSVRAANAKLGRENTLYNREQWARNNKKIDRWLKERDRKWAAAKARAEQKKQENEKEVTTSLVRNSTVIKTNQIAQAIIHFLIALFYFQTRKEQMDIRERVKERVQEDAITQKVVNETVNTVSHKVVNMVPMIMQTMFNEQEQNQSKPLGQGGGNNGESNNPETESQNQGPKIRPKKSEN